MRSFLGHSMARAGEILVYMHTELPHPDRAVSQQSINVLGKNSE
jgi:hypothetical protein